MSKYFNLLKKDNYEEKRFEKISRKRAERKQYPGHTCHFCKQYYKCLNLNEEELKKRLKNISRHRGNSPPKTPDHFYELEFPDDEECLKRGYMDLPRPYSFRNLKSRYSDTFIYRNTSTKNEQHDRPIKMKQKLNEKPIKMKRKLNEKPIKMKRQKLCYSLK